MAHRRSSVRRTVAGGLAMVLVVGPLVTGREARASDSGDARIAAAADLDRAVAEVAACCRGRLDDAPPALARRWAHALLRWLVFSDGRPDWEDLAGFDGFTEQAGRLSPWYVAQAAVHPAEWLEGERSEVRARATAGALGAVERFAEAVYVLAPLEVELRRAEVRRETAVVKAEEAYDRSAADLDASRQETLDLLARARRAGGSTDFAEVFATRRAALAKAADDLRRRIDAQRQEFWGYEARWTQETRRLVSGTAPYYQALEAYRRVAETSNEEVMRLTDEMVKLTRSRDALGSRVDVSLLSEIEDPEPQTPDRRRDPFDP